MDADVWELALRTILFGLIAVGIGVLVIGVAIGLAL